MNKIITDQRHQFSSRVNDLHPSPIREILSVIDRPGMISFAGGLPAVESFPHMSLEGMPQPMLQYGAVKGSWNYVNRLLKICVSEVYPVLRNKS